MLTTFFLTPTDAITGNYRRVWLYIGCTLAMFGCTLGRINLGADQAVPKGPSPQGASYLWKKNSVLVRLIQIKKLCLPSSQINCRNGEDEDPAICGKMPPKSRCDFDEDQCGFQSIPRGRHEFEWRRIRGPTPNVNTGPERDHSHIYMTPNILAQAGGQVRGTVQRKDRFQVVKNVFFSLDFLP